MPDPVELLEAGQRCENSGSLDRALEKYAAAAAETIDPDIIAEALRRQSSVYRLRSQWEEALDTARRSAATAERARLPDLVAEALNAEAAVYQCRGEFDRAIPTFERILSTTENERIRGVALQNLGFIAARSGDLETAESRFRDSLGCFQRAGYRSGEAVALTNAAAVALDREDFAGAQSIAEQAVRLAKEIEDLNLLAIATKNFAESLAGQRRFADAEEHASAALGYFALTDNKWRQVECYQFLGDVSLCQHHHETARSCFERGAKLAREIGAASELAALEERIARLSSAESKPSRE